MKSSIGCTAKNGTPGVFWRLIQKADYRESPENVEEKHNCVDAQQGKPVPFAAPHPHREPAAKEKLCDPEPQAGPQGVENQVVDIRDPAGEKLQKLDGEGSKEPGKEGVPKAAVLLPDHGQQETQGHRQQHVHCGKPPEPVVPEVRKGKQVDIRLPAGIGNPRHARHVEKNTKVQYV